MKWNKEKIIKLLLLILIITFSQSTSAQRIVSNSKDSLISTFLNSKIVCSTFFGTAKLTTDTLFFLDPNKILSKVKLTIWKEHPIKIVAKGALMDSINKFGVDIVLKKRDNYFLLEEFKWRENGTRILFSLPSQNLYSEGVITKETNETYSLGFLGHPEFPEQK